nr:alcohol dehydrogenase catalytic domain-containing protein [Microbacterium pseudoresistens]
MDEVPPPVAADGDVLIAPALVGICGSDVSAHKGTMGIAQPGAIRGHEFAGVVVESRFPGLEAGARVAVDPVCRCGSCPACARGQDSACHRIEIIGVHRPGALADLVRVPGAQAHRLPDDLDWTAGASAEPLAQAVHDVELAARGGRALGRCLVIGAGGIGGRIVQVLARRAEGAGVHALHVVDPDVRRHALMRARGADEVRAEPEEGSAYDTVFDVVGAPATRRSSLAVTAPGGVVVAVGMAADEAAVSWFDLIRRELTVVGANTFGAADYAAALAILAGIGADDAERSTVIPLEGAAAAFEELAAGRTSPGRTFIAVTD